MNINRMATSRKFDDISDWLSWSLKNDILSPASQKIFDKYYYSYKKSFPNYIKSHYLNQTQEAMVFVNPGAKILEVGCGCGTEVLWFAQCGASVVGADLNVGRLNVTKERCMYIKKNIMPINAEFTHQNIFELSPSPEGDFDMIWMEQAFHHIEPREILPEKINSLLRPGGSITICEANAYNPLLQLLLFKERGFRTIKEYSDEAGNKHVYGDERITTPSSISKLFSKVGLETTSVRYFRVLPNVRGVEYLSWIDKIMPQWMLPLFTHFNIVLKKPFK